MFKAGDKVVPNGYRAGAENGKASGEHFRGTNDVMERWESEKKVLTVDKIDSDGDVKAGDGRELYFYHPSELRIAMPGEVEKAAPKDEQVTGTKAPADRIRPGAVVETADYGIGFVFSNKDYDEEYKVGTPSDADYHYITESGIKRVLYYIGEDGGISFADGLVQVERPTTAAQLREGDRIKVTSTESTCSHRRVGQIATVQKTDSSDLPILVRYEDGYTDWLRDKGWEFVSRS